MKKHTGELKFISSWFGNRSSAMTGYIEILEIGDRRFRKIGCESDLFDFFKTIDRGAPTTIYLHKFMFLSNMIYGVRNEKTGQKITFYFPSLIMMMIKVFFLTTVLTFILTAIAINFLFKRCHWGFAELGYFSLAVAGIVVAIQLIDYIKVQAEI